MSTTCWRLSKGTRGRRIPTTMNSVPVRTRSDALTAALVSNFSGPRVARAPGEERDPQAAVVVLGDLARSPRTLAHALFLADEGYRVDLIGYLDTPLPREVGATGRIRVRSLAARPSGSAKGLGATPALLGKAASLTRSLAPLLLRRDVPLDLILVQNPPVLPVLPIAFLARRRWGSRIVVDWHNFGWTILGLRFGPRHPLVRLARMAELGLGRRADAHLCVSHAMGIRLEDLGIRGAIVLHDSAPPRFSAARRMTPGSSEPSEVVLICPMGWSADDDLGLLLEALELYEAAALERERHSGRVGGNLHRPLRLRLSGVGPLRDDWLERIAGLSLSRVTIETPNVSADHYPDLLASADIGLSLHRSSSGVDLPMKVLEMRAVGLPLLILDYGPVLREIIHDGNGDRLFRDAKELCRELLRLTDRTPEEAR